MAVAVDERPVQRGGDASGAAGRPAGSALTRRQRIRRDKALLLLAAPGLLFFAVFQYGAQLGNVIAFKDYVPFVGISDSAWIGFQNFTTMFSDPAFRQALGNTLLLSVLQLIFYFPFPLALALLLHSLLRGWMRKFVISVVYLPHFMNWVLVVAFFQQVLGATGVFHGLFSGPDGHVTNLMGDPTLFRPLMIAELVWKDCGWGTIIFLAALFQVDEQLYEAAALDGAKPFRRFWHVTLPSIRPIVILLLIMRIGDILSVGFEQVLNQRDSFGASTSEVLDTYVYFHGIAAGNFSVGAAAGIFKGVIAAVLVVVANKLAHKLGEQGIYQ
jgi:putative aldouronate transport system permease protein